MSQVFVKPDQKQIEAFNKGPTDAPFQMLNRVRMRDRAEYPADHPAAAEKLSGKEAYARYLAAAAPSFERLGGKMIWNGEPDVVFIGPPDDAWDVALVVEYPSAQTFAEQETDPAYLEAAAHRFAAVLTQIAVRCSPTVRRDKLG